MDGNFKPVAGWIAGALVGDPVGWALVDVKETANITIATTTRAVIATMSSPFRRDSTRVP
jgi:hypothetical protein